MTSISRRELVGGIIAGAALGSAMPKATGTTPSETQTAGSIQQPQGTIDTNVSLFQWPFRRLPYDTVDEMDGKLRSLDVHQAWVGSFEGILHRDVAGVNQRLASACQEHGRGRLIPFGTVNPTLPDWEDDIRRCHQEFQMPGLRLHPNYHAYTLNDPRFVRLLSIASERRLLVQLCVSMEDRRTQHPLLQVPDVDLVPLAAAVRRVPAARIQLLNHKLTTATIASLVPHPQVYFDIARVEATNGISRLIQNTPVNRILFGSHAPFFIPESAFIKIFESNLTATEVAAVMATNARAILQDNSAKS